MRVSFSRCSVTRRTTKTKSNILKKVISRISLFMYRFGELKAPSHYLADFSCCASLQPCLSFHICSLYRIIPIIKSFPAYHIFLRVTHPNDSNARQLSFLFCAAKSSWPTAAVCCFLLLSPPSLLSFERRRPSVRRSLHFAISRLVCHPGIDAGDPKSSLCNVSTAASAKRQS